MSFTKEGLFYDKILIFGTFMDRLDSVLVSKGFKERNLRTIGLKKNGSNLAISCLFYKQLLSKIRLLLIKM